MNYQQFQIQILTEGSASGEDESLSMRTETWRLCP
jgi:hypothetical protein